MFYIYWMKNNNLCKNLKKFKKNLQRTKKYNLKNLIYF